MRIRRIIQKDGTGCGVACAAMLGGVSYSRARSVAVSLGIIGERDSCYTYAREVSALLREFGLCPLKGRRLTRWESLHCLGVVGVNYNADHGSWHWVVYVPSADGGYVLDPKASVKTSRRTDFTRLRPRSYIPVLQA